MPLTEAPVLSMPKRHQQSTHRDQQAGHRWALDTARSYAHNRRRRLDSLRKANGNFLHNTESLLSCSDQVCGCGIEQLTFSSTSTGFTPKKGRVAHPGFMAQAPGSPTIKQDPVSVCKTTEPSAGTKPIPQLQCPASPMRTARQSQAGISAAQSPPFVQNHQRAASRTHDSVFTFGVVWNTTKCASLCCVPSLQQQGDLQRQGGPTCHHVSTMGHLEFPTTLKNHSQAAGLMGSPTVPKIFRDDRSLFLTHSSPCACSALSNVGLV